MTEVAVETTVENVETMTPETKLWGSTHINEKMKRRTLETPAASKVVKRAFYKHQEGNKRSKLSLKAFAREMKTEESKEWFNNKKGMLSKAAKQARQEAKGAVLREMALASKAGKKK